MLRLGIISNPFAKMNKKYPEHNARMGHTLASDGHYEVTNSLCELEHVCHDFCARNINLVGIVGGDGSVGLVLSYLFQAYNQRRPLPKILILKGGTINFLAANLGISTCALRCLQDSLFFIKKDLKLYEQPVQTIEVNERLGFIFAGGLAPAFLEDFYKNKTNSYGAALTFGKYVADGLFFGKLNGKLKAISTPQQLKIDVAPQPLWSEKSPPAQHMGYTLLFASTVPSLPLSVHLFKNVQLGQPHAQMFAISETTMGLLKSSALAFLGAQLTGMPGIDTVNFTASHIQGPKNLIYSLDGDVLLAEDGKIQIKMGPSFIFCSPYYIPHKGTFN